MKSKSKLIVCTLIFGTFLLCNTLTFAQCVDIKKLSIDSIEASKCFYTKEIYFKLAKSDIDTAKSEKTLKILFDILAKDSTLIFELKYYVEENKPTYSYQLGLRRSVAISEYLVNRGVKSERLKCSNGLYDPKVKKQQYLKNTTKFICLNCK